MNAADQKDLYEDLDALLERLDSSAYADVLFRVLETLVDLRTTVLARAAVDRWLRDQANARIVQKMINDEQVTLEEYDHIYSDGMVP